MTCKKWPRRKRVGAMHRFWKAGVMTAAVVCGAALPPSAALRVIR